MKGIKVVLPNAPVRPITVNGGMKMRAWYDIKSIGNGRLAADEDVAGITHVLFPMELITNCGK